MNAVRAWIKAHPREAPAALCAAFALVVLILTQFVFPGVPGGGRGTPMAIMFSGFVQGITTSLFTVGLVLMYRTQRFINFAQGVIGGAIGATIISYLLVFTAIPLPIALLIGLAACGLFGAVVGTFLLRFFSGSRLFLTVVTITGTGFIFGSIREWIIEAPFWPGPTKLSQEESRKLSDLASSLPYGGWNFRVGDFAVDFGFRHLLAVELAIFALAAVGIFLRYTRAGAAVRAMADNPERASLLGISVGTLAVGIWVVAAILDGVAAFSVAITAPTFNAANPYQALFIPLAAAVVARFERFDIAVFATIVISMLQSAYYFSYAASRELFDVALFLIIAAVLLLRARASSRSDLGANVSWSATEEPRPIPNELKKVRSLSVARYSLWALLALAVAVYPYVFDLRRTVLGGTIFIQAIAVLSLVVLTGWAGQVSLGQWALVGVGAVVGGWLITNIGVPFWFAVPICIMLTAAVAVVVGLPALRVKGLFLMVTTFAFAIVVQTVLFDEDYFGWLLPDLVDRPTLFFLNFEDERSMYYLTAAGLGVAIMVVKNLRNSRIGRLLIAVRENEANLQSFGVDVTRAKLLAFAISGGIAGFAGILYAVHQRGVGAAGFGGQQSVEVFIQSVVGGVSSPGGALLGSAYFELTTEFAGSNQVLAPFVGGFFPLAILFIAPGGLISLVNQGRDSILRIVAQRRRIVVPSLFADYDPDAADRQLIPLGDESPLSGLGALGQERFVLDSDLYIGASERIADRMATKKASSESGAFAAAANASIEDEMVRDALPTPATHDDLPDTEHEVVSVGAAAAEDDS